MRAKPDELNRVARFIEPDKQEIALYVALHTTAIIATQRVRTKFRRDGRFVSQEMQHGLERSQFLGIVPISLDVLPELGCRPQFFHSGSLRISFIMSSTLS